MKGWRKWERNNIIHVAERVFVEDAYIPSVSLEIVGHVRFAKQMEEAKQMMNELKN
jgi:hypothetical protein